MRVRAIAVVTVLSVLSACTMWKNQQKSWSAATGGEQFERLFWQDWQAKRFNQLEQHVSATFLGTTPEGTRDRAALLQYLRDLNLADYTLGDFVTQPNGTDLVVSYRAACNGTLRGQAVSLKVRILTVWQQTKSAWVLTAQSVTPDTSQ
jgi:hypothetical protein